MLGRAPRVVHSGPMSADMGDEAGFRMPAARSDEEIRRLAEHMLAGRVYLVTDVPEDLARMVFLPLAFGALADITREQCSQVVPLAVLGEHHTIDRSINGFPIFTEMAIWQADDFKRAFMMGARAMHALNNPPPDPAS